MFSNTERAFAYRSNADLMRARLLFSTLSSPLLVKAGGQAVLLMLKLGIPVGWLVKPTVYKQFVGGETIDECLQTAAKLAPYKVKCILDFAAEALDSEEDINETLAETLKTIEVAAKSSNIPFAVFKPSAFIPFSALEKMAAGQDTLEEAKAGFEKRVETLCKKAYELKVPIMIDAEESWFQSYYDEVVLRMMQKFNRDQAIVYNTLQMYRHDRIEYLTRLISQGKETGFFIGIKFVRGAYMEKERQRAARLNYPSPICADKPETDRNYNRALEISINNIERISIFNGTHNEYSNEYLCRLMKEQGLETGDSRIWFSQLYGMSDPITFNLAYEGYNSAKYLPYGPVKLLIPYLLRRASENTSVAGQTGRELSLIHSESARRRKQKR